MMSMQEKIFAAADALDAAGKKPTLSAVRKAIDGGSYTTISDTMQEWRARKAARENRPVAPPPAAVTESLTNLGAEIWAIAIEAANNQLINEREAFEEAKKELETERQEAIDLANELTSDLEASQSKLLACEQSEKSTRTDLLAVRDQLASLAQRAAAAEARADEASKRADDLNAELARVNMQNAELIKSLTQRAQP